MAATLTTTGLYAFGTTFPEPIDNKDKAFVVQYDVKLDDGLTCGGAYIKLLREQPLDITAVHDKTPYAIMFGPDKCGSTNKVHFILQHLNPKSGLWEEKHYKEAPMAKTDKKTHLYTLYIKPDNGFEIYIDKKLSKSGNLLTDMTPSVNPDEMIDDPEDKKPADWVDEVKIPEPGATKPDDWDESAPAMIDDASATMPEGWLENEPDTGPDPEAQKPEDWDDEEDGVWEAPLVPNPKCKIAPGCGKWTPPKIKNPDYKGKWKVPMIDNPAYKGEWAPRKIPNPYYFVDEHPHNLPLMTGLVVEVLTQNPNIHFDNFVISYDLNAAFVFGKKDSLLILLKLILC
jgi:calnexin